MVDNKPKYVLTILIIGLSNRKGLLITINIYISSYFNKDLINL